MFFFSLHSIFLLLTGSIFSLKIIKIMRGEDKPNFFTWQLWTILMVVVSWNSIIQGGLVLPLITYSVGNLLVTLTIVKYVSNRPRWALFSRESFITLLIIISVGIWMYCIVHDLDRRISTIAVIAASFFAGVPGLIDTFREPEKCATSTCIGFVAVNALALFIGESWSIPSRLQPVVGLTYWLLMTFASMQKKQRIICVAPHGEEA